MTLQLILYSRADCSLCDEMKAVVGEVAQTIPFELQEIDVDGAAEMREKFGDEVPVLFIAGRKAFKYRVTAEALTRRLKKEARPLRSWLRRSMS